MRSSTRPTGWGCAWRPTPKGWTARGWRSTPGSTRSSTGSASTVRPNCSIGWPSDGIVLVPTLTTFHDLAERFAAEFAPALVAQAERQRDEAYMTLTAAHDAGVILAMGFDSGPPGTNVLELMRMVDGGLTAAEAIVAATAGSARALGLADRGILEVGKVADLLAVDGDPLEEPGLLCDPGRLWLIARAGVPGRGRGPRADATADPVAGPGRRAGRPILRFHGILGDRHDVSRPAFTSPRTPAAPRRDVRCGWLRAERRKRIAYAGRGGSRRPEHGTGSRPTTA